MQITYAIFHSLFYEKLHIDKEKCKFGFIDIYYLILHWYSNLVQTILLRHLRSIIMIICICIIKYKGDLRLNQIIIKRKG